MNLQGFDVKIQTRIVFGPGVIGRLGEITGEFGRRALLVTGRSSLRKAGILQRAINLLEEAGVEAFLWDKVEPNPLSTTVDEGARFAREKRCDVVVGLGGGSAMDAAKGIAIAVYTGDPIWRYMPGRGYDGAEPSGALPIVAASTTAGTGSEVNRYAVITNPETHEKPGLGSPVAYPKVAVVDPELTLTLPPRVTASTGADALFHAMEAYIHRNANPMSDLFAERAISLVAENLLGAYENPASIEFRSGMALASSFAGLAIDLAGTVLLHAVGHPVSGHFGIAHGESLAALAQEFIEMSVPVAPERFVRVMELLGSPCDGGSVEDITSHVSKKFTSFMSRLGLPASLRQLGITRDSADKLTRDVFDTMKGCLGGHPSEVTFEAVRSIYERSAERT